MVLGRDYRVAFFVWYVTLAAHQDQSPLVTKSTWKAYCRVEHKRLIRLRSYLVRGYAETTDPLIECVLRLPNGACWTVLAYWREVA